MFYKALLTAMALILSSELAAQLFEVVCSGMCDPVSLELKRQIESSVNENLPDADARTYLKGTANANALASAQVGIDHANDVDVFLFGPSLGAGVDVGGYELGDLLSGDVKGKNLRGLGATPSLLLGLNFATLGFKNYKRWKLFLNFGHLNLSPKKTNIKMMNYGLHVRYLLFSPTAFYSKYLLRWNGLNISTGVRSQTLSVDFTETKSEDFTASGQTANLSGDIKAKVEAKTLSIPLEISSGIQLFYLFTLFAGVGADYHTGSAEGTAGGDLPITTSIPASQLTGVIRLGQKASPESFSTRAFAGLQINLPAVKLASVQLDHDFASKTWGLGLKFLTFTW